MEYFDEINSFLGIHLSHIEEPKANTLTLHIDEAPTNKEYHVYFENYATYMIEDERYRRVDDLYEKFEGKLFCVLSQSHYLDFVRKTNNAEIYHGNEFQLNHYAFYCLDHTVHIATFDEPLITKIK